MITKKQFESLSNDDITKKQYNAIISDIDKRFNEICNKFLHKIYNNAWYTYNNVDWHNSEGYFDPKRYEEYIGIEGEGIEPPPGYEFNFPTRWLWEENWEQELAETIKEYEEKKAKKKAEQKIQREIKKHKVALLQESIKSKLTPEELKIIKFK